MPWLALDIGGAHLKAADGRGFAATRWFPLWQKPAELAAALGELVAASPAAERLAVTTTGELADCYRTKAEGVEAICRAAVEAAAGRAVFLYLTDGSLVEPPAAIARPLEAAASNWHALARFAGRYAPAGPALLVDIGSTTADIIPLVDGQPAAQGKTDPERLASGELVYTGVQRSPVCAVVPALPWRGQPVPVAQELFATAWDAYLVLGDLPEEPDSTHTADGRPATREFACERLARAICADRTMFTEDDARRAAEAVATAQLSKLGIALRQLGRRLPAPPAAVVISGQGEFLAQRLIERMGWQAQIVSLTAELGPELSRCATAHALAVLAQND